MPFHSREAPNHSHCSRDSRSVARVVDASAWSALVVAGVGYLLLAQAGTAVAELDGYGSRIWPASGWALSLLLLARRPRWGWILLGVAAAESLNSLSRGLAGWTVLCFSAAAVIQGAVAAWYIRWRSDVPVSLVPIRRFRSFLVGGLLLGPVIGGSLRALGGLASEGMGVSWIGFMVSSALGVLIVVPLLLSRCGHPLLDHARVEQVLVALAVLATSVVSFWTQPGEWSRSLPFAVLPPLIWAAIRFGLHGAARSNVIVAAAAVLGSAVGRGSYGGLASDGPLPVQLFLLIACGGAVALAVVVEDLQQRDAIAEVLYHAATHDALTDLPNRLQLERDLAERLEEDRDAGRATVAIMCDLDHFKAVNDSFGHQAGDALLVAVADSLRSAVRNGDLMARLGGDEFAVVISPEKPDRAEEVGLRVMNSLEPTVEVEGNRVRAHLSVGLVVADADDDPTTLIRKADAALYEAKVSGRARVRVFDSRVREHLQTQQMIERDFTDAMQRGDVHCAFQPEVFLGSSALFGYEALARWEHPDHHTIMPGRFVPVLERAGRAGELFEYTLDRALGWQTRWSRSVGFRPPVSVNMSSHQLGDLAVVDLIGSSLGAHGASPEDLWIEVTESALMAPEAGSTLGAIKRLGVRTAIDDFGTGWASLERLAHFDWDILKVDQCFVATIDSDPKSISIIRAVIALAHSLDTLVVAEGVETHSQLELLGDCGCDIVQGYVVGRPTSGEDALGCLDGSGTWRPEGMGADLVGGSGRG